MRRLRQTVMRNATFRATRKRIARERFTLRDSRPVTVDRYGDVFSHLSPDATSSAALRAQTRAMSTVALPVRTIVRRRSARTVPHRCPDPICLLTEKVEALRSRRSRSSSSSRRVGRPLDLSLIRKTSALLTSHYGTGLRDRGARGGSRERKGVNGLWAVTSLAESGYLA